MEQASCLHDLDPRAKLLVALLLVAWVFLFPAWSSFALLAALLTVSVLASGLPPRRVFGSLRSLGVLWALCLLAAVAFPGEAPLWRDLRWEYALEGAARGAFLSLRVALLVTIAAVVHATTTPSDAADAIGVGFEKVPRLGRPAHRLAFILVLAWSFVPILAGEARKLDAAQRARGAPPGGGLTARVRRLRATFVPLLIGAVRSSERLALAMEARGFGGDVRPTHLRELRWRRADALALAISAAAAAAGGVLWAWEKVP